MNVKKTKKPAFVLSLVAAIAVIALGGIAAYAASPAASSGAPLGRLLDGGRNVTIHHPDGRIELFDNEGNLLPATPMQTKGSEPPREMTLDEIRERVRMYREKGLPAPEAYLEALNEAN